MANIKLSEEEFEKLVEEGRQLLMHAHSGLEFHMQRHFASFPSQPSEPHSHPYSLPWYIRINLEQ